MISDGLDRRLATACREYLASLHMVDDARRRMHDARRGQPRSPGASPGRSRSLRSPVESAAEERDIGGTALRRSAHDRLSAARAIEAEVARIHEWVPRDPDAAARISTTSTPGTLCEKCDSPGVYTKTPSTVGGRLDSPQWLCRSCYEGVARTRQPRRTPAAA